MLVFSWLGNACAVEANVTIDNFTFRPAEIVVAPGTRITWINQDDIPHTVFGKNGGQLLKSPPLDTDDRFSATFDTPGRYVYFCSLHPHMQGAVVVQ